MIHTEMQHVRWKLGYGINLWNLTVARFGESVVFHYKHISATPIEKNPVTLLSPGLFLLLDTAIDLKNTNKHTVNHRIVPENRASQIEYTDYNIPVVD